MCNFHARLARSDPKRTASGHKSWNLSARKTHSLKICCASAVAAKTLIRTRIYIYYYYYILRYSAFRIPRKPFKVRVIYYNRIIYWRLSAIINKISIRNYLRDERVVKYYYIILYIHAHMRAVAAAVAAVPSWAIIIYIVTRFSLN